MRFFHQNVEGIGNKLDLVELMVDDLSPHFLVITEHQKSNEDLRLFNFEGFALVSSYSRVSHKGGGVALFAKKHLCDYLSDISWAADVSVDLDLELAMAKLSILNFVIFILCIYRSPNGDFLNFLEKLDYVLHRLSLRHGNVRILILGDLNINTLIPSSHSNEFNDLLLSYGLCDTLGHIATRVQNMTRPSSIDHIITNVDDFDASVINCFVSDHFGQIIDIYHCSLLGIGVAGKERSSTQKRISRRVFSDANVLALKAGLAGESWDNVYDAVDLDGKWTSFFDTLLWHLDVNCPIKKSKLGNGMSPSIGKVILEPNVLMLRDDMAKYYDLYRETGLLDYKFKYTSCKKDFRKRVAEAKSKLINEKINNSKNVSKSSWAFVNSIRSPVNSVDNIELVDKDNCKIVEPDVVSNIFNDFFVNSCYIDDAEDSQAQNADLDLGVLDDELFIFISEVEVLEHINNLNSKTSYGWDQFSPILLKKCKYELIPILLFLIQGVFDDRIFPQCLKLTLVRPLHKKGSKNLVENYRPISLTSTFGKLIEKFILVRLKFFFSQNNLLSGYQHGFRGGRSTISAAADFVHQSLDKLNNGFRVAGVCLDLSKAFDRVNHNILLKKLVQYGLPVYMVKLIKSYLSDRLQYTEVLFDDGEMLGKFKSDSRIIDIGVPQGSILGPFLYIVYVNDFPGIENVFMTMYADDATGMCWAKNLEGLIKVLGNFVNTANSYFKDIKLLLNSNKTEMISFGLTTAGLNVSVTADNGVELVSSDCVKFLGLFIDKCFSWTNHIDHVKSKLLSGIFLLRRLSVYFDIETLRRVYFGVIYPFISYGLLLWGCTFNCHVKKIFVLQKKALRIITKVDSRRTCKDLFIKYGILTVYAMYIFQVVVLVKGDDAYTMLNSTIHNHNTRQRSDFYRLRQNYSRTENSPFIKGAIFYNRLPNHLKQLTGQHFKNGLKKWLISKAPYSLTDLA